MTRRTFLIAVLSSILFPKKALSLSPPEMSDEYILRGLLDALIPSDETPGAKEANIYEKLMKEISGDSKKKMIYDIGLSIVRKEIEKTQVATIDWDSVLERISKGMDSMFFTELRKDALRLFYSDPTVWKAIGYDGPPLIGYLDYYKCD
jgi:hypothetical protein